MLGQIFEAKENKVVVETEETPKAKSTIKELKNSSPTVIGYPVFATSFALVGGTTTTR